MLTPEDHTRMFQTLDKTHDGGEWFGKLVKRAMRFLFSKGVLAVIVIAIGFLYLLSGFFKGAGKDEKN